MLVLKLDEAQAEKDLEIPEDMTVRHWALREMRQYVIKTVKAPLDKAIILAASLLPEITRKNCRYRNTFTIFDIRDLYFQYETNRSKMRLLKAAWTIFIFIYEHDPFYRFRFDWLLEVMKKLDWEPRNSLGYETCWTGPDAGKE